MRITVAAALALSIMISPAAFAAGGSGLSDKPIPMKQDKDLPKRTPPLLEIGPRFLDTGNIDPGIELPTGAIWQPALWLFGDFRSAIGYFDNGPGPENQEWANRLELFANLQFTPTERFLLGFSPFRRGGNFTGYTRRGASEDSFNSEFNADITTFFFEGEFGEIFPNLDPDDRGSFDVGFAIGRQPIFFQEGIMINDTIDAIGITRDTILIPGLSPDLRVTALYGWNDIDRNDNREDDDAHIVGLFTETDFRWNTLNVDFAYVLSTAGGGGDTALFGVGSTQRIGHYNSAIWANVSWAPDERGPRSDNGAVIFTTLSRTLPYSEDIVYVNAFWGIDNYTSAARGATTGGPLGQMGLLYAAVGLGNYGAALSNRPDDAVGLSAGYQLFFNNDRTQLVLELGGRQPTVSNQNAAVAAGARLQFAIGRRYVLQFDGFVSQQEGGINGAGLRSEFAVRF